MDLALEYYQKCKEKSTDLDNIKLELDCFVNSLDLREKLSSIGEETNKKSDYINEEVLSEKPSYNEYMSAFQVN